MKPSIKQLRLQCRLDDDDDSDDELLTLYAGAARRKAENYTNRKLYDESVTYSA
ncbi:TPA: head-tail connector protein [Serratia fonticola]|uniref:Phage gp6-like head-tail connector protein n=1 Tax=Serratia fonticola TaxID=47917 RepID=A0A448SYQ1_SERFO|nr:head-tail connector protein [Serratia fonticola]MBL5864121.1 phage head-tail connector protein [Serratia fonticola]CAI1004102.1 Phage gp6-like head-tail connector protein [Serratia fonticola]VEI72901.1 Phage gp6-like head-tail connector protein [Serratia fonticola]